MRFLLVTTALLLLCALALAQGPLPWNETWAGALARLSGQSTAWNALLDERLPRLIVLACTGASLAVAGAVMQSLFQNPLAAPSVLGITFGGSLAVLTVLISGLHLSYPQAIPLAACLGSLATLLLVTQLSQRQGPMDMQTLILNGIAISTVLIAVQRAILYALRDNWHLIQTISEWEAGSSANRSWQHVHMQLPLTLIGLWGCWRYCRELNILTLGEEEATHLGVDSVRVRTHLFLCIALLTGGALAALGGLAFFGLILPHLVRRLVGPDNGRLIPLCIIAGAGALIGLDTCLRVLDVRLFSIGNVSAVLGGLLFVILLVRERRTLCYS